MLIKCDNLIEKSNILNTLRCGDMGLTELRFFCLYLSRLNARNPEKRTVEISIKDFEQLFGVKFNTTVFNHKIEKIMTRTVKIKNNSETRMLTLYSEFRWNNDNFKVLNVTCNYDVVPYLFELQKNYTTYMIGNIAKLDSVQKIRLYEILKQYEKIGIVKFNIIDLQEMMCCTLREFKFFRRDTLEPAVKDINKHTDIMIYYEKILSCRRVTDLKFVINKKNIVKLGEQKVEQEEVIDDVSNKLMSVYYKCNKEYTIKQLKNIWSVVETMGVKVDFYIVSTYLNIKAKNQNIKNIYNYTLAIINAEAKKIVQSLDLQTEHNTSYNIDDFKDLIHTTERYLGEK